MFKVRNTRATLAWVSILLAACASPPAPEKSPHLPPPTTAAAQATRDALAAFTVSRANDGYMRSWLGALQLVGLDSGARAIKLLDELTHSARFNDLTPVQQHAGLLLEALVALDRNENDSAHHILIRSTAMDQAGVTDWDARSISAYRLQDHDDVIFSLTTMIRRWPGTMVDVPAAEIRDVLQQPVPSTSEKDARFQLLNVLFDTSWTNEEGAEPGWGNLVEELVARDDLPRAAKVIAQVNSPRSLLAMRVDRRYDALVRLTPASFDVAAAVKREVDSYERAVQRLPRSLHAIVQLIRVLFDVGEYSKVIEITDGVIEKGTLSGDLKLLYDDGPQAINWIYDTRADALARMGQAEQAEIAYRFAAERLEFGQKNISNMINLAGFLADHAEAREALDAARSVHTSDLKLSAFGKMQQQSVVLEAATILHDSSNGTSVPVLPQRALVRLPPYLSVRTDSGQCTRRGGTVPDPSFGRPDAAPRRAGGCAGVRATIRCAALNIPPARLDRANAAPGCPNGSAQGGAA